MRDEDNESVSVQLHPNPSLGDTSYSHYEYITIHEQRYGHVTSMYRSISQRLL